MATATLHLDDVGGYEGPAKCWKLDPPKDWGGYTTEYVTVWIQPEFAHQNAETKLVPAGESGAAITPNQSMWGKPGTAVLHDTPDTEDYVWGVHWLALLMLGYDAVREVS